MKLLRVGEIGKEKPAILDASGKIRDLSSIISDLSGEALSSESLSNLANIDLAKMPIISGDVRIGACVADVGKFICIGLNYSDHAAETNATVPDEPIVFTKFTNAICGPNDDIIIPKYSTKTDWEVELGVVIGKRAKYVSREDAFEYVAGYCTINDLSEREFQLERHGQWVKGKSCDNFGPIGPYLVTKDEIADPHSLELWLEVDGHRYQDGNTKTMVYDVAYLVSYLSQFFTLEPGDIISTGTPPGVGLAQEPQVYLKEGQKVTLGISGLGIQYHRVVKEK